MRDNPVVLDRCEFFNFVLGSVLIESGSSGFIYGHNCIELFWYLSALEGVGAAVPDWEDTGDCEIGVEDGAFIQGIINDHDHVSFTLADNLDSLFSLTA